MNNLEYENKHYALNKKYIAGVDEVGRGPLAGPVVSAAVIMPKDFYLEGITDSKKLSEKKRNEYEKLILENATAVSISFIDEKIIDEINIYEASRKAMIEAINNLKVKPDVVLVDAMPLDIEVETESIIKGDEKSFTIACASIVAKQARDRFMDELALKYPNYGFEKHKGYPTKLHKEALKKYGVLDIHRKTYKPVQEVLNNKG